MQIQLYENMEFLILRCCATHYFTWPVEGMLWIYYLIIYSIAKFCWRAPCKLRRSRIAASSAAENLWCPFVSDDVPLYMWRNRIARTTDRNAEIENLQIETVRTGKCEDGGKNSTTKSGQRWRISPTADTSSRFFVNACEYFLKFEWRIFSRTHNEYWAH